MRDEIKHLKSEVKRLDKQIEELMRCFHEVGVVTKRQRRRIDHILQQKPIDGSGKAVIDAPESDPE